MSGFNSLLSKVGSAIVDAAFWSGWNLLWILPEFLSRRIFAIAAWFTIHFHRRGMAQLTANLQRLLNCSAADAKPVANSAVSNYMRYYCETFLLPKWTGEEVLKRVRVHHADLLKEGLKTGGIVTTLPHAGNWDLAGAWAAHELGSLCTVAERLRPEGVYRKFMKARRAHGLTLMGLTGDGNTYEWLRAHVAQGKVVALLGDRDVARNGMGVKFCGHRAVLPIGAALLALDTGRPLFPVHTYFDADVLVIDIGPEVQFDRSPCSGKDRLRRAAEITGQIAQHFEEALRKHPDSWAMLQPVWPDLVVP